jgi:FAD/FMN-containing dehydrogenase
MSADLLDRLRVAVGPRHVLTGDLAAGHCRDWTGRFVGSCTAVVRPGSTDEVVAVMAACGGAGVPVVAQGGNTGLVGGAVPQGEAVVLSMVRLDAVGPVDPVSGQLTAGAGSPLARVQEVARGAGWRYPVDFAARDTATIGGTIATNAGGHHVVRYGMTRQHVVGVEAVLADGSVISRLGGLVKDNTGYDLAGLLCGSEGTLAVITAARLALVPDVGTVAVALVGFTDVAAAIRAVGGLRRTLPGVEAIELMCADGMAAVGAHLGASIPISGAEAYLLVEVVSTDPLDELATLDSVGGLVDAAVASDAVGAAQLWRWRESHTEVINRAGPHPPHKFDVTLPLASVAAFIDEVRGDVATRHPGARVWIFGHAGDGNLHVNVTGPSPDDTDIDALVLGMVARFGGSISAEHGIGRAKQPWLHLSRSATEIAAFTAIKAALDPRGLLNPGVLLPDQRLS